MPLNNPSPLNKWLYQVVGSRIREARGDSFTQQQLAEAAELNRSSIAKIEAGGQRFTIDTLFLIAKKLGKDSSYFLPDPKEYKPKPGSTKEILKKGLGPDDLNKNEFKSIVEALESKEQ